MNVQDNPAGKGAPARIDYDRFRLKTFLAELEAAGELERRPQTKLTEIADVLEGNPKAVLFDGLGANEFALVGGVMSSRGRMARAFGVNERQLLGEVRKRLGNRPDILEVSSTEAPTHQVVLTGDDVDLTKLPLHLQHGKDGGLYISAGMDFCIDKATGWTNVGLRRFMVRSRNTTGVDLLAPSDLRAIYLASLQRGERLPVSVVVGAHPVDYFASSLRLPVDELGILSQLRATTLPVVKCVTNDIRVPADAEWVLEGYLGEEGYSEPEGPYGEFLGYYGAVKTNPVFHVTAITHRADAVFQTITIGGYQMSRTDTAQLSTLRTEVLIWRALEGAVREPVAVYVPPATGGVFNVRVAIRQRSAGEARNAIAAAFGAQSNSKNVFVVDPDIDVFSDQQMEWALATRFQPDRDLVVASGFRTLPLDPSLDPGSHVGAKAGYDLTLPYGGASRLESEVPKPPGFEGKRFESIEAALADGPKYFEQLMSALGVEDGRPLIAMLDDLTTRRIVTRETQHGRYCLAKPN